MDGRASDSTEQRWSDYYRATAHRPPRELYRLAVERFGAGDPGARLALDLGCGAGIETLNLLQRGWRVLAIDKEPEAIEHLRQRVPLEYRGRLVTQVATFESTELPAADFIWAGLSLPFCPPADFPGLWDKIETSLTAGGRFAGDLFGTRNAWASRGELTFLSREAVTRLCANLVLEDFREEEGERPTALEGVQYWHGFAVVARKPDAHPGLAGQGKP
jgi:SAM-dependent methyltransferase